MTRTKPVSSEGVLSDLRVLEFTAGLAGPWIGRFLAYCGAEVIRVESLAHPDVLRLYVPPRQPELGRQPRLSPWFTDWNAGKRFVGLDLARPRGRELARRLAALCDVVVENYASGVIEKLGLGYEELRRIRPDLIMLSSSGFGGEGPCAHYVTWGPNLEALSGLSRISGFPHRECTITQFAYPDVVSALHGLVAVMSALEHRERTGEGQHIRLSQYEATVATIGAEATEAALTGRDPERLGNRSLRAVPHGCYPCRGEDRWCAIAVHDDAEWRRLCRAIGRDDWERDPQLARVEGRRARESEIDRGIEKWTRERTAHEAMRILQEHGVAAGAVQTVEDLARRDEQLAARGFLEEIDHLAKGKVVATALPVGVTDPPGRSGRSGAAVGEDNDYVFGTLLGLSREEIEAGEREGVIQRG